MRFPNCWVQLVAGITGMVAFANEKTEADARACVRV
jgi:hypothetical protein